MIRYLVLLGALAGATACHHAQPSTFARLNLVPEDSGFVMGLDAAKLKQSHLWAAVGPKLVAMGVGDYMQKELDRLKARCDLDPVRDVHWMMYVAPSAGDRLDKGVVLINGNWDRNKVERCAAMYRNPGQSRARTPIRRRDAAELGLLGQAPAEPPPPPPPADYLPPREAAEPTGAFTKYGDFWLGWVAPDTAAISFERDGLAFLGHVIENSKTHRSSVLHNPSVASVLKRVDPDAVLWFAGVGEEGRFRDMDPFGSDVLKHATETFLSVSLGNELQLHFSASQRSTNDSDKLSAYLAERVVAALRGVPLVDRLKVTTAGTEIHADAHLDAPALDTVAMLITAEIDKTIAQRKYYAMMRSDVPDMPPVAPAMPPPPADRDGDGIPDDVDKCPDDPEDKDGFQDADGCPDPDNDGDGIPDIRDKCPNQAGPPPDGCPLTQQQLEQIARDNEKRAGSRTAQALEYLSSGVYDKALEEFQAAYKLIPQPLLLFDIALTYDKMKDQPNALAYYKRYVDAEPDGVKAKDARKRIAEITKALDRAGKSRGP